ncbi:hypothetical protein BJ138DRAFT_1165668 [Hygrophoropsis aurantiaca]|uniref:Uncharacterized protein n=1 Tax=Hygrophoropsis aurantiaca TaxID=72124 RepID=A0ACB7ZVR2_9AGAM|nr:hypothetical protein BJ138DRAFT_1165668 [Hygrophoropsis aurantiaca]
MFSNLLNTALLCLIASPAVHAFKTHNYTVEVTGKGGHKTSYSGTLPEFVECDTCQSLKKASYEPEKVVFLTGDFEFKGSKLFQLRFYDHSLCTDKKHIGKIFFGLSPFSVRRHVLMGCGIVVGVCSALLGATPAFGVLGIVNGNAIPTSAWVLGVPSRVIFVLCVHLVGGYGTWGRRGGVRVGNGLG